MTVSPRAKFSERKKLVSRYVGCSKPYTQPRIGISLAHKNIVQTEGFPSRPARPTSWLEVALISARRKYSDRTPTCSFQESSACTSGSPTWNILVSYTQREQTSSFEHTCLKSALSMPIPKAIVQTTIPSVDDMNQF